ncbi:hypothetical protein HH214_18355 [Mucilaginibacter robiniae]|uniref:Uncharacterized protein n=1 Tax=Mucilaginibacter robiniae TaxID=2728022 RepID=A0A7L5E7B6_9SPHI|nr:hypothetical protein [Mucilaginibacter robiniae]QJD97694.1 hypothetical protein HH214_18355 [Mucilaginibacter robiniae]
MTNILLASTRDWFDYVRDIVTIVGYLATVGTFLYLFRRDNDKQKQIDSLAKLALLSEEQLVLSVRPDLYKNGARVRPDDGNIMIDLLNRGEHARLLQFNSISPDITLHSKSLPYVLEKGSERLVIARSNGKNPNDCEYVIEVVYEDKLHNQYKINISGKGAYVSFDQAVFFKHRHTTQSL